MAWREITEADILTKISGKELEALRAKVLADGQVDPVQPVIDLITRKVRGYVANCTRNRLGDGNTVPDELIDAAVSLIIINIMTRVAGTVIDPKDARMQAYNSAMTELRDASLCNLAIEAPDTVSDEVVGSQTPSIRKKTRKFTDCTQDGI